MFGDSAPKKGKGVVLMCMNGRPCVCFARGFVAGVDLGLTVGFDVGRAVGQLEGALIERTRTKSQELLFPRLELEEFKPPKLQMGSLFGAEEGLQQKLLCGCSGLCQCLYKNLRKPLTNKKKCNCIYVCICIDE